MSISFFVWQHIALWTTGLGEGECHCLLGKVVGANHASAVREVPNPALVNSSVSACFEELSVSECVFDTVQGILPTRASPMFRLSFIVR